MTKNYYWINDFNGLEQGGPFKTIKEAKADAEATFIMVQDGMALSIDIVENSRHDIPNDNHKASFLSKTGKRMAEGHIEGGQWAPGVHPRDRAV
jgi:hypothetical protein